MAVFSGRAAIASGFRLVGRRPVSAVTWGLIVVLTTVLPQLLVSWSNLPDLMAVYREVAASLAAGAPPTQPSPEMLRVQAEMGRFQFLQFILGLVGLSVVTSAILRAVLDPEAKAFASLRVGRAELGVGLTLVVLRMLMAVALFLGMTALVAARAGGGGVDAFAMGMLIFLAICGATALVIWLCLRLSLAPAASFTEGKFRLIESWPLTRGHGWRLLGVSVALGAIFLFVEFVVVFLLMAIAAVASAGRVDAIQAFMAHPPANALAVAGPWLGGALVLYVLAIGPATTIVTAAFADIYRQLSGTKPVA